MIELTSDGKLHISTKTVDDIDYDMSGKDFPEYAKEFLVHGLNGLVPQMLAGVLIKQGVKPEEALKMAEELVEQNVAPSITVKDVLVNAMVAHYAGDESSDKQTDSIIDSLLSSKDETTQLLGSVLASLLHDPNPSDNNLTIDLESGEIDAKKMRKKR